jgi:uncharacterized protein
MLHRRYPLGTMCSVVVGDLDAYDDKEFPVEPRSLSDSEFDHLNDCLGRFGGKRSMNLEGLDGFLAALICGPDEVPRSEYLPEIWAHDIVNENDFLAQPSLRECVALINRHRDFIYHTLESGDVFTPLLLQNEDGIYPANDWAMGFLHGMELRRKEWDALFNDEEHGGSLIPILALANEHSPDPTMRPYSEPVPAQLRERLIVGAASGVMKIYRYFGRERQATDLSRPYQRFEQKVGRNERCPCGSGKKFKHCCGRTTLH